MPAIKFSWQIIKKVNNEPESIMSKENRDKHVYRFGGGEADGDQSMKELLGGKGANLAEMSTIGIPVPAGFTISTEACHYYSMNNSVWPEGLKEQVTDGVKFVEQNMNH